MTIQVDLASNGYVVTLSSFGLDDMVMVAKTNNELSSIVSTIISEYAKETK